MMRAVMSEKIDERKGTHNVTTVHSGVLSTEAKNQKRKKEKQNCATKGYCIRWKITETNRVNQCCKNFHSMQR